MSEQTVSSYALPVDASPPLTLPARPEPLQLRASQTALIVVPDTGHVELVTPGTKAFEVQAEALASFVSGMDD